jgi:CubicO group peptidase (beta-lactamase class C family)
VGRVGSLASLLALAACGQVTETIEAAPVAAGLVARTLCTAIFVQGREEAAVRAEELGPDTDSRLDLLSARVDRASGSVGAGLLGLSLMSAGNAPGLGCAVDRAGEGAGTPVKVAADPRPFPQGDAVGEVAVADRAALQKAVAAAFVPGAYGDPAKDPRTRSIAIVHDGRLVLSRHAPGWGDTVPQYSASMSKTVAAALAGLLVAEGRIGLDSDALLPEWQDGRRAIRLRHLLDMESGLVFNEAYGPGGDPARMLYAEPSAALFAAARPLEVPPGTRFSYSSGDTNIMMRALRLRSGRTDAQWDAFPRDALFTPLGMRSALFEQDAAGDFVGSTFVYASVLDWARFGLMLADGGVADGRQILPADWVARMRTPTQASDGRYSTQTWFRGGVPGQPAETLELAGYGGQYVTIVPATRTVIVRMGFQPDRSAWDQQRFLTAVFPALGVTAPTANRDDE